MFSKAITYRAYLLRLWRVHSKGCAEQASEWRASLEEPHTRERFVFATVERLFAFLADQLDQPTEEDPQSGKDEST